ncbi:FadR/GntR family transcriptional regulator [Nocardioides flavescens]|uniref:FCD domain-containing protein n=1 Tax=Nocardioides flavescens TaxID=2691959 RepID=A0A6L7EUW6_9ACTN|nr:FadR/GntR family transcriptional regulator [Nocardioides flavescens]MXG89248.1 FCD domain-containing protein [Nocardioides flavescens]
MTSPDPSETDVMGSIVSTPWPRRPRRLATVLVEELVDRLVGGELAIGATLPTEPMLCETFGVSRTVVREAVKSLETMRLVTVQQGHGTRIRPMAEWDLFNPTVLAAAVRHDTDYAILEEIVDVRRTLEARMAGQAAEVATPAAIEVMQRKMVDLDASTEDPTAYLKADVAFHDSIMAASRNRLARAMVHNLTVEAYRSLRYVGDPSTEHIRATHGAHRRILESIVAGDATRASTEMDEHIIDSWQRRRPAPVTREQ